MSAIEVVCTITAKGQTTVPKAIRQALGVGFGDHIAFRVEAGTVSVRAVPHRSRMPRWRRSWPCLSMISRPGRRRSPR